MEEGMTLEEVEEWRPVIGFEDLYQVSNLGRVRSIATFLNQYSNIVPRQSPCLLKLHIDRTGYFTVCLYRNGTQANRRIHRLVLESFVGPRPDGCEGAHLDGSSTNNNMRNLAWVTPTENNWHKLTHGTHLYGEHHPSAKLNSEQVGMIRSLRQSGLSIAVLGQRYGVLPALISQICLRQIWKRL